jgi:hypothetical protein
MSKPKQKSRHRDQLPLALLLAEDVPEIRLDGHYDTETDTWSDREYASAGSKKHNEDM